MERSRGPRARCAGKAPPKKRRASPLPGAADLPDSRAGVSQMCRRRLFGKAGPCRPEPAHLKKKLIGKNLPKIKENVEYTEESSSCNQSSQVTVGETTDFKIKEDEPEESSILLKESKVINFESEGSLKNVDMTSSVSTFLIECLNEDSAAGYSTAGDSLKTYSSPEAFRDDDLERCNFYSGDLGKYKNSTLLDSSKAVTIDKIPQISNLSAVLEPVPEDFPDRCVKRKRPSNCYYSSSALSISATLAEEGSSSFRQPDAPENMSDRSQGLTAVLPTKPIEAVMQMTSTMLIMEENEVLKNPANAQPLELDLSLSPVCTASPGEDLFLNTTVPFVNSEEIVPASLSSEKEIIFQSPEEKNILKPLCDRREICSIIRMSPGQRPSRLQQVPVNQKKFCIPKGVPEDTITSTKNWTYCKKR